jgi:hypothetical protein
MRTDLSEGKVCPACGDPFLCGAAGPSCWCATVELSGGARARATGAYRGCLCPGCLRLLADGRMPGEGPGEGLVQPSSASSDSDAVAETTSSWRRRCRT